MKLTTRELTACAMIAALYTALCIGPLSAFSFGPMQVRVAEAFAMLPVFSPVAVLGVTLGCGVSNLVGFFIGVNIIGYFDILFGTAATLAAALLTRKLRRVRLWGLPVLSAVPPILVNAVVIGAELTVMLTGGFQWKVFAIEALNVGMGQLLSCAGLGLPLVYLLQRTGAARVCFGPDKAKA